MNQTDSANFSINKLMKELNEQYKFDAAIIFTKPEKLVKQEYKQSQTIQYKLPIYLVALIKNEKIIKIIEQTRLNTIQLNSSLINSNSKVFYSEEEFIQLIIKNNELKTKVTDKQSEQFSFYQVITNYVSEAQEARFDLSSIELCEAYEEFVYKL